MKNHREKDSKKGQAEKLVKTKGLCARAETRRRDVNRRVLFSSVEVRSRLSTHLRLLLLLACFLLSEGDEPFLEPSLRFLWVVLAISYASLSFAQSRLSREAFTFSLQRTKKKLEINTEWWSWNPFTSKDDQLPSLERQQSALEYWALVQKNRSESFDPILVHIFTWFSSLWLEALRANDQISSGLPTDLATSCSEVEASKRQSQMSRGLQIFSRSFDSCEKKRRIEISVEKGNTIQEDVGGSRKRWETRERWPHF